MNAKTPRVATKTPEPIPKPATSEKTDTETQDAPVTIQEPPYTDPEMEMLAKTVWGEARGLPPDEQRLVVWTVFQRVDAEDWGDTVTAAITAPGQFYYKKSFPVNEDIYALCVEETEKWQRGEEPPTHEIYAPTAPYRSFNGDGKHNWFRE